MAQRQKVPDGSATAKAIDYSLTGYTALTRHLDESRPTTNNNWIEDRCRLAVRWKPARRTPRRAAF